MTTVADEALDMGSSDGAAQPWIATIRVGDACDLRGVSPRDAARFGIDIRVSGDDMVAGFLVDAADEAEAARWAHRRWFYVAEELCPRQHYELVIEPFTLDALVEAL